MDLSKMGRLKLGVSALVIPDAHGKPGEQARDWDRFTAAGKLALDLKPDVVICLGDIEEFESLSEYSRKAADAFDGKALKRDGETFRFALKTVRKPIVSANEKHKLARHREREYHPTFILLEGNHEERWRRFPETELLGHDYLALVAEEEGWIWHPFLKAVEIGGVLFSHYFESGVGRRPATVNTVLNKTHRSVVFGHSHSFGYDQKPVLGRRPISALCAGCYKPPHRTREHEWSGLTLLTDIRDGSFNIQQLPYDAVLERYGEGDYAQELRTARAQAARDRRDIDFAFS
jgi:predicted phosphodiesterase